MTTRVIAITGLVAVIALLGCGGGNDGTTTTTTMLRPVHSRLTHCPASAGGRLTAGGWSGSVAGIGCGPAGRLILHHFAPDLRLPGGSSYGPIRTANPAPFRSAGFNCGSFPLEDGSGWHILCDRDHEQISFFFTP